MPPKLLEPRWRERGPWHVIYAVSGLGLLINQRGDSLSSSLSFLFFFSSSIATRGPYGLYKDSLHGAHGTLTPRGWTLQLLDSPSVLLRTSMTSYSMP